MYWMWGEYTPNVTCLYDQTLPPIIAYAECGWTPADKKKVNYLSFEGLTRIDEHKK
jgi:hypothetical protein